MGVWTQKQATVQTAITLGVGFKDLIDNNLPSGVTFAVILNNNLDNTSYINNQLVFGTYDTVNNTNNAFGRYRDGSYSYTSGTFNVWSNTYALTASVGDTYTIIYQ